MHKNINITHTTYLCHLLTQFTISDLLRIIHKLQPFQFIRAAIEIYARKAMKALTKIVLPNKSVNKKVKPPFSV